MNMHTATDVERAISVACELHDDRAGQVGSRRPDRQCPPQTILDASDGEAALDMDADDDRASEASTAARKIPELVLKHMTPEDWNRPWREATYLGDIAFWVLAAGHRIELPREDALLRVLAERFFRRRAAYNAISARASDLRWAAVAAAQNENGGYTHAAREAHEAKSGFNELKAVCDRKKAWLMKEAHRMMGYSSRTAFGCMILKDVEMFAVMFAPARAN